MPAQPPREVVSRNAAYSTCATPHSPDHKSADVIAHFLRDASVDAGFNLNNEQQSIFPRKSPRHQLPVHGRFQSPPCQAPRTHAPASGPDSPPWTPKSAIINPSPRRPATSSVRASVHTAEILGFPGHSMRPHTDNANRPANLGASLLAPCRGRSTRLRCAIELPINNTPTTPIGSTRRLAASLQ